MFDSMQSTLSQSRLAIGLFHTDVESSDCFSVHFILAGYVNAKRNKRMWSIVKLGIFFVSYKL